MADEPMTSPAFKLGVQRALQAAGKCGASCPNEAFEHTACVRERGHAGMHDGMLYPPWGDKGATAEQNGRDARESWLAVHKLFWAQIAALDA